MLLEASHLVKNYAAHTALNDVSVAIPEGEIMGLLGPNGAGKSTLIRIFNRIIAPDSGAVLYKGQALTDAHTDRMGYMPEERGLYKKMEIGEQVLYLARLKGMTRNDAVEGIRFWFQRMELESWIKKKVGDLSKGMQQKIQFIVTVIHKPDLIILDEPFSGFDPINANLVKDEILRLKADGATIMLSTHRMESVEELCDNITLINKAHVVLNGSVRDVRLQHRSHTYTVTYGNGQLPPPLPLLNSWSRAKTCLAKQPPSSSCRRASRTAFWSGCYPACPSPALRNASRPSTIFSSAPLTAPHSREQDWPHHRPRISHPR